MHAMIGVYTVLVIWLQLIMALNADIDGQATFGIVEEKENTCGNDIIINKLSAIVSALAWKRYGGCGAYFKVTCVKGKEDCAEEGASVTVQAINFFDNLKENLTLSFEAFEIIAAPTSTLIKIQYTYVTEPGDAIMVGVSDYDSEDSTTTDVSDNGLEDETITGMENIELEDKIMDDTATDTEDGWANFEVVEIVDFYCDEGIVINGLSAIVSEKVWIKYGGCGAFFKITCVKGLEDCAKEGASVTVQAVDYAGNKGLNDNFFTLAFEAFDTISDPKSTLINIKFSNVGLGNSIGAGAGADAGAGDEVNEDVIMADTK